MQILSNITAGIWRGTAIEAQYGGTGFTTYAAGDLIYASAANVLSKLAKDADGKVLTLAGGLPTWATPATAPWTISGTDVYYNAGFVFIGDTAGTARLTITDNTLTTTSNNTAGILLTNNAAATSGAPKYSPPLLFKGQGWDTQSGGSSKSIIFRQRVIPLSGFAAGGKFVIERSLDGGTTFVELANFGDNAALPAFTVANNLAVIGSVSTSGMVASGSCTNSASQNTPNPVTNNLNVFVHTGNNANSNGTNTLNVFSSSPTINNTGGTSVTRFAYFNPTVTSLTNTTFIGFQNTRGNNLFNSSGESTGIGVATTIHASAKFQVDSTTQGVLPTRMTTTQRDAIASPAEGLEIYNLTTHKKNFYNGSAWEQVTSS